LVFYFTETRKKPKESLMLLPPLNLIFKNFLEIFKEPEFASKYPVSTEMQVIHNLGYFNQKVTWAQLKVAL
jgi:hypothetical protein